jgi:glycosyltransferase involved in cell wall biosynthesis
VSVAAVIAAYNEGPALGEVLDGLRGGAVDFVVVVDDGSRDDTHAVALAHGAHALRHRINLGQGAALATGIRHALAEGARAVVTFDADGQHDPADIPALLAALEQGNDVALGSRFMGTTEGLPARRRLVLQAAVLFTKATTGLALTDAHNGLRALSRRAAETVRIRQNRMAHASEILEEIARHRLRFAEVPVRVRYTAYSLAKGQRLSGGFEILLDLLKQRLFR